MSELYDAWLSRKLQQTPTRLHRSWIVSKTWKKHTGGRILYGEVTLTAAPSLEFSYHSIVSWPTDYPHFQHCVIDGILDAIFIDLVLSPSCVEFKLENIGWHDDDSVPRAYYQAARGAVGEIFALDAQAHFEALLKEPPNG